MPHGYVYVYPTQSSDAVSRIFCIFLRHGEDSTIARFNYVGLW